MIESREKIAIILEKEKISYAKLLDKIANFSNYFSIKPNDRVVIYSENRLEWIYAFYAIWMQGGIPVPVDFMSSSDDVAFILQDCNPSVIFSSAQVNERLVNSLQKPNSKLKSYVFEDLSDAPGTEAVEFQKIESEKDKTAVIIYTSGTTGSPKGVMLSFENLLINIRAVTQDVRIITEEENVMMLLPLHHIFPLMGTLIMPLYVGGTIAVCPSLKPEDIMNTLNNNKVSIIISVPRFYDTIRKSIVQKINAKLASRLLFKLAKSIKSLSFSRLIFGAVHKKLGGHVKYMVAGGAALGREIADDYYAMGFEILEGYGMTEAAPMISFTRPGRYFPGSAGEIIPGMEVKVQDGEIIARGNNVMQGYYNRQEETKEIVRDGWLYTGDLGTVGKNNEIYITGRKKEIIVLSSGKNINPVEIESKLVKMSAFVKEVGVFLHGNILQAILVPDITEMKRTGIENIEDFVKWELIDKYNKDCSPYKKLMKFSLSLEELPKTRLSKLQRFKLADIVKSRSSDKLESAPEPQFKEYLAIKNYLENETGNKVFATDHLEMDVALDSLGKITLLVFIENNFGVEIAEDKLSEFASIQKIAEHIKEKKTKSKIEVINWSAIFKEKIHFTIPESGFSNKVLTFLSKLILKLFFRLKGEGTDNLPEGPCIIAPNHQSAMDGFLVASFLRKKVLTRTYVYAKEKHWKRRWQKYLASKNNIILMDINKDLKLSLQKMAEVLKKGKNIMIFPEGTRSKDGHIGNFKKTFAILSQELNIPVIPVAIKGSYNAMPSGRWFPRLFSKVNVKFLQPVYPVDHSYDSLKDLVFDKVARHV